MPSSNVSSIIAEQNPEFQEAAEIFDARGIIGIVFIIFFEICTPIGVIFPTDAIIFVSWLLYGATGFPWWFVWLILVLIIPVILGNMFGYRYGEKLGNKLSTMNDTRYFKKSYIDVWRSYFDEYGNRAFYIGTFLAIRSVIPPIAGILKRPRWQFLIHTSLAGIMWLTPLIIVSYSITAFIPAARNYISIITILVVLIPQLIAIRKIVWPKVRKYTGKIHQASGQFSKIADELKHVGSEMVTLASSIIHDTPTAQTIVTEHWAITTILLDAIGCVISSDADSSLSSLSLNKELADYIDRLGLQVIVVTNATDNKLVKIAELLSPYTTSNQSSKSPNDQSTKSRQICSYANNPPKTDPQYFRNVIAYYQLTAETVLYIDHAQTNLASAQQAGIKNIMLYTGNMELAGDINSINTNKIV